MNREASDPAPVRADYMDENVIAHAFHHNAFLIVSNGDRARYGSITGEWEHFAEWKRLDEADRGSLDAEVLLNGMLAHDRLLDMVENFILFDDSKPGATRKVIARNHQVLGVNRAVASVARQEELKRAHPPERRLRHRVVELPLEPRPPAADLPALPMVAEPPPPPYVASRPIAIVERAHPDLGRLGVFWHTQGSGKSYSMVFFAEKVRRRLEGNFTFLLMTDRNDLDSQIYRTFVGCGIADDNTPRAASGDDLEKRLKVNHRNVFSLIHKFNKDVDPKQPYSERDDIIVISDEAHRTQAGRLARNMRAALPNAAFIGFTGTPLFKQDELTKRIFGDYVSRYDFKRSEEDGATVKLVYANRGEKLGVARADLNDRIAEKIEEAELDPDQAALLERLLGQDYEVVTADERLDKIAADFVEHCATRWQSGKSMLVCIDKITCARMHQLIVPRWQARAAAVRESANARRAEAETADDESVRTALAEEAEALAAQAAWLDETIVGIIISEAQNEVRDFARWGFDIIPHRARMKQGFETADGERVDVETAFKSPEHPFRVAIVCAMWLTGFDVECLSTLYIDKPMKAHSLMQAIARANRVYPGKDFGLIVDYTRSLLGEGTDQSGHQGLHPRRGLRQPADPAIHARREGGGGGRGLHPCLAAGRPRRVRDGGVDMRRPAGQSIQRRTRTQGGMANSGTAAGFGPVDGSGPEVAEVERDRIEGADADRFVVFRARDEHPLTVAKLERVKRAVRRVDEPQVSDTLPGVDRAFAVEVEPARGRRQHLAHPVRREGHVGRVGEVRHPLAAPPRDVGDQDVLAKVKLGLVDDPPPARATSAELKRVRQIGPQRRGRKCMGHRRARVGVERSIDDLGDPMRGRVKHILVGGAGDLGRFGLARNGAHGAHLASVACSRRDGTSELSPEVFMLLPLSACSLPLIGRPANQACKPAPSRGRSGLPRVCRPAPPSPRRRRSRAVRA